MRTSHSRKLLAHFLVPQTVSPYFRIDVGMFKAALMIYFQTDIYLSLSSLSFVCPPFPCFSLFVFAPGALVVPLNAVTTSVIALCATIASMSQKLMALTVYLVPTG